MSNPAVPAPVPAPTPTPTPSVTPPTVPVVVATTSIPVLPADASVLSISTGLIPLAVTIFVAYLGARQYWAARAKFNLDLFDKRFECFKATWAVFSEAHQHEEVPPQVAAFREIIPKVQFLFGKDVLAYVDLVDDKIKKMQANGAMQ